MTRRVGVRPDLDQPPKHALYVVALNEADWREVLAGLDALRLEVFVDMKRRWYLRGITDRINEEVEAQMGRFGGQA